MNILTFDIEEWFHLLDNDSTKNETDWVKYDSRIHDNMEIIFDILDSSGCKATFFVLGWIAEKYPEVVRAISDRGYEIGSHTHLHQLVYSQSYNSFYRDVEKSIKILEDCIGKKVTLFRAPGFSITEKNKWAFEALYELGISVDSSIFPAGRSHGGMPSYKTAKPSILKYHSVEIKEFPISTTTILGNEIVFSGGGYFRLFPYSFIKYWSNHANYIMTYFHPRDFDGNQPIINDLSYYRRFKSYVGLNKCKSKLERWIADFDFTDIAMASEKVNWEKAPVVNLTP